MKKSLETYRMLLVFLQKGKIPSIRVLDMTLNNLMVRAISMGQKELQTNDLCLIE